MWRPIGFCDQILPPRIALASWKCGATAYSSPEYSKHLVIADSDCPPQGKAVVRNAQSTCIRSKGPPRRSGKHSKANWVVYSVHHWCACLPDGPQGSWDCVMRPSPGLRLTAHVRLPRRPAAELRAMQLAGQKFVPSSKSHDRRWPKRRSRAGSEAHWRVP